MTRRSLIALIAVICIFACWQHFRNPSDVAAKASIDKASSQNPTLSDDSIATALMHVQMPGNIPSQIKKYEGFTLSFNKDNHTPNYVAWELAPSETDGTQSRYNKFWQDPEIEGCANTSDYVKSGFDRGHICPSADQKWSENAMKDCFVMANICPQDHRLNAGAWATLEKRERKWSVSHGGLIIISGPIYEQADTQTIGHTKVRVPSAFFKIFLAHKLEKPEAIAVIYPNMPAHGQMTDYYMTVDEVEQITGFDFFSALPDKTEEETERTFNRKIWK